jgi:DNA repair protein RecN (Recombination protein N)
VIDELRVANLGVITDTTIEPGPGFVVVTGETGAGKTLLLGALRLLTGDQARRDAVGPAGEEAVVEGRFVVDGDEVVARRRVTASGRSRAYLGGEMVTAGELADRTGPLVEVVAQHDQLTLATAAGARRLLDGALDGAGAGARSRYDAAWAELAAVRQRRETLGGGRRELERELEVVRHQADEIEAAGFRAGDDADLAEQAARLRNVESIAEALDDARAGLDDDTGAPHHLAAAQHALGRLARLDPGLEPLSRQADEVAALLGDLAADVARAAAGLERDPGVLDAVEQRLHLLGELRRKYGDGLEDVLGFAKRAVARAGELIRLLDQAATLEDDLVAATEAVGRAAAELTTHRRRTAGRVADGAVSHLRELGFSDPVVEFAMEPAEPGPTGADAVTLTFASDMALRPGPVTRVASGGELSRLILALRLAAGVGEAPIIAFDEVDAGVGGATALAMGRKLAALAAGRQVLCVTHLPQVAAFADLHFVVDRSGGAATVRPVAGEERLQELSRMLSGLPDSERGRLHAAELVELAGGER